ncbi:unnamed protein product [Schistocephalus solidus]|uniref:Transposase n=1 Tax=Schistocephalus solidus TaxID=70667 RepID=A0A183T2L3_SCHSO|nr:unnamed protein product [Schistocephalus solidus]
MNFIRGIDLFAQGLIGSWHIDMSIDRFRGRVPIDISIYPPTNRCGDWAEWATEVKLQSSHSTHDMLPFTTHQVSTQTVCISELKRVSAIEVA